MVMMPLAPQFEEAFSIGPTQWSIIVSSYAFAAFVSGVLSIFFIDKIDRKKFLLMAYAGFIIGTFLCSTAEVYSFLVFARILTGVFGGLIGTIVLAIVGDLIPLKRRARAMGVVMTGFSAAAALGVPLGIYFADKFSWEVPFVAIAIFACILFVASSFILPSMTDHLKSKEKMSTIATLKHIFASKNRNRAFLFFSTLIFGHFLVIPFLSPVLVNNLGFTNQGLMYVYLFGGLCTIITSPVIGKISDQYGRKRIFSILLFISAVPVLLLTNLSSNNMIYALFISSLFFIFVSGRLIPAISMVVATAESQIRGTFMSLRSSFQQLSAGLASFVSGFIISKGPNDVYLNYDVTGYISVAICLITIFLSRKLEEVY